MDKGILFFEFVKKFVEYEMKCKLIIVMWGNMDMKVLKYNCEMVGIVFLFFG